MLNASMRKIVLVSFLGSLTAMIPGAEAAEPEPAPSVPSQVTVDQAPDTDLPPQIIADVRAEIENALAGRPHPGVPIAITLDANAVLVRVGSLWRRIAIGAWDYPAVRTVALHVLDLLQPGPEVPEVAPADPEAAPAAVMVSEAPATERAAQPAPETAGPLNLSAAIAGARGAQGPDPWMVSGAIGAAWTQDWALVGLEVGWDHAVVRHPDGMTTVNYDAVPVRLVLAAENSVVRGGLRAGIAGYRVTGQQQAYKEVTPLVGPFLAARFPIAGQVRGLLVGGFDYFARRTELSTGNFDTAYSTPAVAPYVAIDIEVVLRP